MNDIAHYIELFQKNATLSPLVVNENQCTYAVNTLFNTGIKSLKDLTKNVFTDIFLYNTDETNFKVKHTRAIIDQVAKWPLGTYQIIILEDVHKLTVAASNSLLKTLEDVPKNTLFLLTTNEVHALLPTITSRVTIIDTSDNPSVSLSEKIQQSIDSFFEGDTIDLLTLLFDKKLSREEYTGIAKNLLEKLLSTDVPNPLIHELEETLQKIHTSNASAKDMLILILLKITKALWFSTKNYS